MRLPAAQLVDPPDRSLRSRRVIAQVVGQSNELGLDDEPMKIELSRHDPAWETVFAQVKELVLRVLGDTALVVEHVGSTAVADLSAKPVIDVVLVVSDSSDEAGYVSRLEQAGFTLHVREPEWHQHRLLKFQSPSVNLHVFSDGCPEVARMVRFRDLLRTSRSARELYQARKQELALREWNCVQDYADEKSEIVARLLESALGAAS